MITVLDTNALIRFFTKDDSKKAISVKNLIENEEYILIPDVVFPELEYVLLGVTYNSSRLGILTTFKFLISQKNIHVSETVKKAVEVYEKSKLDMADSIIAASAICNKGALATFDEELKSTKGLKCYW